MKNKLILLIIVMLFFTAGCSRQSKEKYLITHPQKFNALLDECQKEPLPTKLIDQCKFAVSLRNQITTLNNIFLANPEGFGKKIIAVQTHIAALAEKIKSADSQQLATLQKQQQQLKQKLEIMLIIVGIYEQP